MLFCCQGGEYLPGPLAVTFVPAMKRSLAYQHFARCRRLCVLYEEQCAQLGVANKFKKAQMRAAYDAVLHRANLSSNLQEFTQAKFIELFEEEVSRIVETAEHQATSLSDAAQSTDPSAWSTIVCPSCKKTVRYKQDKAGGTVRCPYNGCRRAIVLPPLVRDPPGADRPFEINS